MICGSSFFRNMKNAVPAFRFRFSRVDDALKSLVESCRNADDSLSLTLIAPYAADVSTENSLAFVTSAMCRRTVNSHSGKTDRDSPFRFTYAEKKRD